MRVDPWSSVPNGHPKPSVNDISEHDASVRRAGNCARTMRWSQPDFCIMFATNFAVIGARLLSFLSWRA